MKYVVFAIFDKGEADENEMSKLIPSHPIAHGTVKCINMDIVEVAKF